MRTAPYFPHPADTRRTPAIIGLIADYGFEGYGRWWAILEYLREHDGVIPNDRNVLRALALELQMNTESLQVYFNSITNEYKLLSFEEEKGWFSIQMNEHFEQMNEVSAKRKEAVEKRWKNAKYNSNTNVPENDTSVSEKIHLYKGSNTSVLQKNPETIQNINISSNTNVLEGENILSPNISPPPEGRPAKPKRPRKPKAETSEMAVLFADFFATLLPKSVRVHPSSPKLWAEAYDQLIKQGRTLWQIVNVCYWARMDDFWSEKFLSFTKLTETDKTKTQYFDVFHEKMKKDIINGNVKPPVRYAPANAPNNGGIRATDGKYSSFAY